MQEVLASLLLDGDGDDLVFELNLRHFNLFHDGLHHGNVHLPGDAMLLCASFTKTQDPNLNPKQ